MGASPYRIYFNDTNTDFAKQSVWLTPSYSNEVFEQKSVEKTFFLVLLLVVIGEFFASPAIALADSAIITSLGDQQDKYGAQRMFGSIGWGVLMFIMGIVLDYSDVFPNAKCELNSGERNYNVCFYMFSLMMFIALVIATQIQFRYIYCHLSLVLTDCRFRRYVHCRSFCHTERGQVLLLQVPGHPAGQRAGRERPGQQEGETAWRTKIC